jgi:hypothetical protein
MNIKDTCYVTVIIMFIMVGCATPLGNFMKQEKVVKNIERQQSANEDESVESGRTFVYAADRALQHDPKPSRESKVAKQMTTRSMTALGPPKAAHVFKSDEMISDLLSDDPDQVEKGQAELVVMDKELIAIQNRNRVLSTQLQDAQVRLKAINQENALQATKYSSLMGKVYWIVGVVIFLSALGIGLKILTVVAPFALPSRGASSTLLKVVQGIQKVRDKHEAKSPELQAIDDHLRNALDQKDRWMITRAKQKLQMI